MLTMLFSRCQLRSTCITVYQLSFSIVLLFLNRLTRWHVSFFLIRFYSLNAICVIIIFFPASLSSVAKQLQHELFVCAFVHFEEKRVSLHGIPSWGARCSLVSTIIDAKHVLSTFVTWSTADRHSHTSFPRFRTTIAWFTNVRIYRSVVTPWLDIYWARVSLLIGLFLWQLFLQKYCAIDFTFFIILF